MARPTDFEIKDRSNGSALTVWIAGELDMTTAQRLSQHLEEHLSRRMTELTLDLGEISFMDSSGLRLLIELHDRSQQQTWQLKLKPPKHEAAALVLRATGADAALPFVPTTDRSPPSGSAATISRS
jgi:anti-anti-sigma factor